MTKNLHKKDCISSHPRLQSKRLSHAAQEAFIRVPKTVYVGKSRIHGWGALSKMAHQRGDLVIEYSGELIRPSVADAREQQLYDRLVGAGTYVFRMNEDVCVDATAAGTAFV